MLGKDIYEFILDKDHSEMQKQFMDKFEGTTVHGMGLSASGNNIEMDVNISLPTGTILVSLLPIGCFNRCLFCFI